MILLRHIMHPIRSAKSLCLRICAPVNRQPVRMDDQPLESLPNVPDLFGMYRTLFQDSRLRRMPGGWVYAGRFYPDYLTMGGAGHAIFTKALQYCQGIGIDVGAGLWPLPGAVPVDVWRGGGAGRCVTDFDDASLDYVFSSHCLEHIENWQGSLTEWTDKLKVGGVLFLYLPHPDCAIWHPGSPFVGDGHKWSPTPAIIRQTLLQLGYAIVHHEDGPDAMHSFCVCARK